MLKTFFDHVAVFLRKTKVVGGSCSAAWDLFRRKRATPSRRLSPKDESRGGKLLGRPGPLSEKEGD